MLPSLDPVQFSALLGVAVVRALAAVALFFSLQFGTALQVYSAGFLVEVGVEVVVEVEVEVEGVEVEAEVEVEVEVAVEVVVEAAWAMLVDKVAVGSDVGCIGIVGCYYNIDDVVGCYYNIDDDDEHVG